MTKLVIKDNENKIIEWVSDLGGIPFIKNATIISKAIMFDCTRSGLEKAEKYMRKNHLYKKNGFKIDIIDIFE